MKYYSKAFFLLIPVILVFTPAPAHATQGHIGIEGLYIHQLAHIFFIISMILLWYWIRKSGLQDIEGWRYISHAALIFILWNIDAFTVHYLESHPVGSAVTICGAKILDVSANPWITGIYLLAKMDNIFCVSAMLFLFMGLRRIGKKGAR